MEYDELAQHLESLERESCYRVDDVLKQSPVEVTQRVFFVGSNGAESGPFIRKFIKRDVGMGAAYERIFAAQQNGRRFKYIPDIVECYSRNDRLVVVMECVKGETLQEVIYQRNPSLQLAREVFPLLCDAVSELHREFDPPIIHRDLKPSNVILTGQGLALIDYGISREYKDDAEEDTTHFGTRAFAPPEQYGFSQTTVQSDIYSLGMVLFFCLTETIPTAQTRKQAFSDPRIPEPIRLVIERATALDPASRHASVEELKNAFVQAASHDGQQQAQGQLPAARTTKNAPRKRLGIGIAVAVCALILLIMLPALGTGAARNGAADSQAEQSATNQASENDETLTEITADDVVNDLKINSAAKNGFDPATNFTVDVVGVEFQVPSYFRVKTSESEDGSIHYYYAEHGSSVAMLMTSVNDAIAVEGEAEFEHAKDSFVNGMLESGSVFESVVSSTDYELAGRTARVVTFKGTVKGVSTVSKAAFFFELGSPSVGSIIFGQTVNAQFDYSEDFAKVVTSAKSAAE